jgi:hypothetical protein
MYMAKSAVNHMITAFLLVRLTEVLPHDFKFNLQLTEACYYFARRKIPILVL